MMRWSRGRRELKINLETLTRCGGSCGGCMLDPEERARGELWPRESFERLSPFVSALIEDVSSREDLAEASINMGPADHLLVPTDRPDEVLGWMRSVGGGRVVGFMTVSAVGRPDRIRPAADAWRAAMDRRGQPMCVDMVFDPAKTRIERFHESYAGNIGHVRDAFGAIDLNLNVGPETPSAVSPEELHAFVRENGFANLTLNVVPNRLTARAFAESWDEMSEWLGATLDAWRPDDSHGHNAVVAVAPYLESEAESPVGEEGLDRLSSAISEKASMEVLFDGSGRFFFSQAGFGDTPFSSRFGFSPSGSVEDPAFARRADGRPDAVSVLSSAARRFAASVLSDFARDRACQGCPHVPTCSRAGIGVTRRVMGGRMEPDAGGCPVRMNGLLDAVRRAAERERDMAFHDRSTAGIWLPKGFEADSVPHGIEASFGTGAIDFGTLRPGGAE